MNFLKQNVMEKVAVPASCKSEASVTKAVGREAAEGALTTTDELSDGGIDIVDREATVAAPFLDVNVGPAEWTQDTGHPGLANQ